jgi:hypothetical protein
MKVVKNEHLEAVFSKPGLFFVPKIARIAAQLRDFRHTFFSNETAKKIGESDFQELERIYWLEILYRAHIACATNLIRTDRWIKGILQAYTTANYLCFSASYRGLLESSVDAHYSLVTLPKFFANQAETIHRAVERNLGNVSISAREIEDRLIHFTHGRNTKKENHPDMPESHNAQTMRKYIDEVGSPESQRLHNCYSELCDVTHPSAQSLLYMLDSDVTDDRTVTCLYNDRDAVFIHSFCQRYKDIPSSLFQNGVLSSLMTLKLLNLMNLPEITTSAVEDLDLSEFGRYTEWSSKISEVFHR